MYRDIEAKKTTFADDCIPSRSLRFFRLKSPQILTTDDSPVAAVGMPNKGILPPPFYIYKRLTSSLLQPLQGLHREVSQRIGFAHSYLFSEHHRADVCPHLNKTAEGLQISSLRTLYLKASTLYSITPHDFIVSSLHTLYLKVSTLYSITPQGFIVLPPHASYREAFRPSNLKPFGLRGTSREIFPVVAHRHGSRKRTTRE